MTDAVMRKWEAQIARSDIPVWKEAFMARVLPVMRDIDGFGGISVLASQDSDPCKMTVLTRWKDMAAIKALAGDDPAKTYLPDFMEPFFPSYDERATFHDEVVLEVTR